MKYFIPGIFKIILFTLSTPLIFLLIIIDLIRIISGACDEDLYFLKLLDKIFYE